MTTTDLTMATPDYSYKYAGGFTSMEKGLFSVEVGPPDVGYKRPPYELFQVSACGYAIDLEGLPQEHLIPSRASTEIVLMVYKAYHDDDRVFIVADFGEPIDTFPVQYQQVVEDIREHGRELLAGDLVSLLSDLISEDIQPHAQGVVLISIRDLARMLIEERDFRDPRVSPDNAGTLYAEWEIYNDGVVVMGFPGYGEVVLTAQADEGPNHESLDISERGPRKDILAKYRSLLSCISHSEA